MRRVLLFVDAFDVLLVRSRCFLVTLLHVLLWHSNTQVTYYFNEVSCYVCVQLGIFSRSYYVLIMSFLARSVVWRFLMCVLRALFVR
jgi:hypothetical protein